MRLGLLRVVEISEAEFEALENGTPVALYLNLALTVVSIAISFSVTLATTSIESTRTFCVFIIITVIGYLAAVTFGALWLTSRRSLKSVSAKIRARITPHGIQEPTR